MPDDRDYRIKVDLDFPPALAGVAQRLVNHLAEQLNKAVNINPTGYAPELGFIELQRCGHRLGLPCDIIARWAVGKGQVI